MWQSRDPGRNNVLWRSRSLLSDQDFWQRIGNRPSGVLVVAFLESWKRVADQIGIDAVDLAENVFASLFVFATRTASERSRLSVTAFAAYWSSAGPEQSAVASLRRWLPMELSSGDVKVPIEGSWAVLERGPDETARELFQRVDAELEERMRALPPEERHRPLTEDWDAVMKQ